MQSMAPLMNASLKAVKAANNVCKLARVLGYPAPVLEGEMLEKAEEPIEKMTTGVEHECVKRAMDRAR